MPSNERDALIAATAALAGAASAYRTYAKRHASLGKVPADPFFSTRVEDMDRAVEAARTAATAPNAGAPLAQWVAEAEHLAREYGGAQHSAGTSSVTDNVEDWEGGPAKRANEARDRLFAHLAAAPAQQAGAPLPLAPSEQEQRP